MIPNPKSQNLEWDLLLSISCFAAVSTVHGVIAEKASAPIWLYMAERESFTS